MLLETTLKRCVLLWKPHRRRACCFGNHTEKVPAVLETTPKRYVLFWKPHRKVTCCLETTPKTCVLFWKPHRKGTCCFGNHAEKVRAVLETTPKRYVLFWIPKKKKKKRKLPTYLTYLFFLPCNRNETFSRPYVLDRAKRSK